MLKELELENFKGFKKATLTLGRFWLEPTPLAKATFEMPSVSCTGFHADIRSLSNL